MNRFASWLVLSSFLVFGSPVWALHPKGTPPQGGWHPKSGITVGGGVAYVHGGAMEHAFSPSLEFSYFQKLKSPFTVWGTIGGKIVTNTDTAFSPYIETGINLLILNLGLGYGVGVPDTLGKHHVNGFAGLSIPIFSRRRGGLIYTQMYYRPILSLPSDTIPFAHEFGLMLKWLWAFHQKQ